MVGLFAAEKFPQSTVLVLDRAKKKSHKANVVAEAWISGRNALGIQNCLFGVTGFGLDLVQTLASLEGGDSSGNDDTTTANPKKPLVRVQFLPDLLEFLGSLLPHEYEELLGRVLCLSERTLMPSRLPDHRFFSYWKDATSLLLAAGNTVGVAFQVSSSEVKAKASGPTASYSSQYGYSASSASPSLLSVTWSTLTGTKEGQDSSTPSPQASSGVSVAMLAQLGIIGEGHQRLFGAFLHMAEKDVVGSYFSLF